MSFSPVVFGCHLPPAVCFPFPTRVAHCELAIHHPPPQRRRGAQPTSQRRLTSAAPGPTYDRSCTCNETRPKRRSSQAHTPLLPIPLPLPSSIDLDADVVDGPSRSTGSRVGPQKELDAVNTQIASAAPTS
ncbi:hypothetical protein IAQ61_010571 [Plenodomus lingam]|uniref:uncharacterized protein n=1 Tax=Leptosphaeria maculans TaxID=5022 RepID=UPI00331E33BB|nr:hypothetical protein IAQ61_010571 [Plenodomus lingam]